MVNEVQLSCHPGCTSQALERITARLSRKPGALALTYILEGDLDRVRLPVPRLPRVADGLWQHTCCEIFIGRTGLPGYHEFNLSPSGEWAAYAFGGYRAREPLAAEELDPRIAVQGDAGQLELDASIALERLSPDHALARLSLGISAVIEHKDGSFSYWALRHPGGKPDFHHPDGFALVLDEVRN